MSSSAAQTDTPVGVSGFTPAPRQQFTENNQLSSEMCTPERGLLIPFAREPNWRTLVILKRGIHQRTRWSPHTRRNIQMSPLGIESHTSVHVSVCIKSRRPGPLVLYCVLCSAADSRPVRFMWAGPVWSLLFISSAVLFFLQVWLKATSTQRCNNGEAVRSVIGVCGVSLALLQKGISQNHSRLADYCDF